MKVMFKNWNILLVITILLAAVFGASTDRTVFAFTTDSHIFINEIHYDNAGADADEGVEIAAPAGTDLTDWSLVAYNGSNGAVYSTLTLSGTITDQQNGYGTKFFAISGLQNGAPDGVALVEPDDSVVMFLSYEGSFTATDGPAIGLTSTDIGVFQSGSDAIGLTLQLSGVGYVYEQFTWQSPAASTYNLPNNNQTFGSVPIENIIPNCPSNIVTYAGVAASDDFSAADADGTVTEANISSTPVSGISLTNVLPAEAIGGELTGTISVTDSTSSGNYDVEITFMNDDSPTPQTATCTIPVTVIPETCPLTDTNQIGEVQGEGSASPLVGTSVTVSGIVVADLQGGLNGFNIQDFDGDGNPLTSDGIFVYNTSHPVEVGDPVQVTATVSEYNGLTELTSVSAFSMCGTQKTVAPTEVSFPLTDVTDFEKYEGMLVTFPQDLIISEYFNFDRYGEIVLTSTRHMTPTALYEPGSTEQAAALQDYLLDRITLDDGRSAQNPDPAIHPNGSVFDLTNLFRGGDLVTNVTGVVDYSIGVYRIQPTQGADYTPVNNRPTTPPIVGGELKVASFNVLNYFTTLDGGAGTWFCGPSQDMECRGADNIEEFNRQRAKIIAAITSINADVVGLMEIENNINDDAVIDLVAGLNDAMGANTYEYVDSGVIGTDAIKVAMIFKPASVTPQGTYAILDTSVDSRFLDDKNRPALAQSFEDPSSGEIFTVVVNHLKSKGSSCDDVSDPDLGDGAGNCNLTRKAAAEALVDWLATDPTGSGSSNYLIIGDLNSYDKEDPIDAILAGADDTAMTADDYTDLMLKYQGDYAYGYVFDGQTGYLDHALANAGMEAAVTGVNFWHINADEPDLIDYDTSFKLPAQDLIYAPDAYRSSDHDPVIIGIQFVYVYYYPIIFK